MSKRNRNIAKQVRVIILTAAAYALVGRLSLLLAIPPGYASPVWPAAAISLFAILHWGYSAWPGVLIGSFFTNVWIGPPVDSVADLELPLRISFGAVGHALLGAYLIRRLVGYPAPLLHTKQIANFLILGGPVTCLVSGLWGPLSLLWTHQIPSNAFLITFLNWWIGDSIGVLVASPLLLVLAGEPRDAWQSRRWSVALPFLVTLAIAIITFVYARQWERQRVQLEFNRQAQDIADALDNHLDRYLEVLESVERFFAGSNRVEAHEFHTFALKPLARYPGIAALSWNRLVPGNDLSAFESEMREAGNAGFRVTQRGDDGTLIPVTPRGEHVVVTFIEPLDANAPALGFDVVSDPLREASFHKARDSGRLVATERLYLVQESERQFGTLIALPIFARGQPTDTVEDRRRALLGYVVEVFRLQAMVSESLRGITLDGFRLRLFDVTDPANPRVLSAYDGYTQLDPREPELSQFPAPGPAPFRLQYVSRHIMADRSWSFYITPTLQFLSTQQTWDVWLVLAAGLLFTTLLGVFLLSTTGQAIVDARRLRELRHRNEEMEQFLYTLSHDLKSPVLTLSGFSGLASKGLDAGNLDAVNDALARITAASTRMSRILEDLLELSRIGRSPGNPQVVDVAALLRVLAESLDPEWQRRGITLHIQTPMHHLFIDRDRLARVFENLLLNATRYGCDGSDKRILVGSALTDTEARFYVRDHGPGIPQEQQRRIFEPFKRLHKDSEGTGVGLTFVTRIVNDSAGHCWVDSEPGQGATFWIAFPRSLLRTPEPRTRITGNP